jgi:hypothetical protein
MHMNMVALRAFSRSRFDNISIGGGAGRFSRARSPHRASFLSASEQYHFTATTVKVGAFVYGVHNPPGRPTARNLMEAGYELVLYNRTRSKAEELARGGAEVAENPKEVARKSEVIFTMLPGPPEVEKTVTGEGGLLEEAGRAR